MDEIKGELLENHSEIGDNATERKNKKLKNDRFRISAMMTKFLLKMKILKKNFKKVLNG